MSEAIDSQIVRELGRSAGLDAVGICLADRFDETRHEIERRKANGLSDTMQFTFRNPARSTDPQRTLDSVQRLVVGALSYRPKTQPKADGAMAAPARIADYAIADYYSPLRDALEVIAQVLRDSGHTARVVADENAIVDRAAAHRAGLGWFGKNANLLLVGHGSQFVLGSVLTDAPLEVGSGDAVDDGCGACRRCIAACPTDAIVEPGVIDARRCLAWLVQKTGIFPREYRVALADRIYGCDDCQSSCPVNRPADNGDASATSTDAYVDAVEMLELDDEALLAKFGRWYIPRREPRYLRRNALLVAANTARPDDPRIERVVCAALASKDEIIAAHAIWTARRLGRDDWIARLDCPRTEVIQRELALEVPVRAAS